MSAHRTPLVPGTPAQCAAVPSAARPAVLTAWCKVNLGLRIVGVRSDGYHLLDSVFLPLSSPRDRLDVAASPQPGLTVACSEPAVDPRGNTLTRAHAAYAAATGFAPGLHVTLHKGIPAGAGLGGGSSDAAAILRLLNRMAPSPLTHERLREVALHVGADVPFFLQRFPCRVGGIGETLTPCPGVCQGMWLVLVCPPLHVSTRWAFSAFDQGRESLTTGNLATTRADSAAGRHPAATAPSQRTDAASGAERDPDFRNDLEPHVLAAHPLLADVRARLLACGAMHAFMSGSGSSFVGLFPPSQAAQAMAAAAELRRLAGRVHVRRILGTGM